MAVLVACDKWRELLSILKSQLPDSATIYGQLKTSVSGEWPYYSFWVDQWPRVTAVVATPMSDVMDSFSGRFHVIHGQEAEVVSRLLQHPGVLDRKRAMTFDLPPHLLPALRHLSAGERGAITTDETGNVNTVDEGGLITVPVPDNMAVGHVTRDDVTSVCATWEYSEPGVTSLRTEACGNQSTECMRAHIRQPAASCARTCPASSNGRHVVRRRQLPASRLGSICCQSFGKTDLDDVTDSSGQIRTLQLRVASTDEKSGV
ncbi:uncharacterized protein LOC124278984 [Haliotis rubra]|uniref:uncharacterized protein LOC124278984 n=1 Tax=Haliotis rubra TaxID=36100 RepID=UPI001EE5D04F|nr:uncharacterized protein LOC124278984 [Haliotis rubra]